MRLAVTACTVVVALALAGAASSQPANHVTATLAVSAALGKQTGERTWNVDVDWSITCNGATEALYFGDLNLVDQDSGERIYLGGISGKAGKDTASVTVKTKERHLKPLLKASCSSYPDLHGSGTQELLGNEVTVPLPSCDPDLLNKALREFATAKGFYDAGSKTLKEAHDEWVESRDDYLKESAEIGVEKAAGLKIVETLGADAVLVVEVTAFWVGIGVTIEEVALKLIPALKEVSKTFKEAKDFFEQGEKWTARAKADLKKALEAGPCLAPLEKKLDQALDAQRKQDAARSLIEGWENNGYLYVNPANGELLDEAAALRAARAILEGRSTQARSQTAKTVKANRRQILSAVAKLTNARAHNERARSSLKRADAAAQRLRTRLKPLLR
jgi:hypothetical protein